MFTWLLVAVRAEPDLTTGTLYHCNRCLAATRKDTVGKHVMHTFCTCILYCITTNTEPIDAIAKWRILLPHLAIRKQRTETHTMLNGWWQQAGHNVRTAIVFTFFFYAARR